MAPSDQPNRQPYLSILVPCFNEAAGIVRTVETIISHTRSRLGSLRFELLVVDDGSTDSTKAILHKLRDSFKELVVLGYPVNRGRGAAIREGIIHSSGEFIVTLDADLSYDVNHIDRILDLFEGPEILDVVVVSPYMKGGNTKAVPTSRLILSRLANYVLAGFFDNNLSTVTCVVRGYRGQLLRSLPLFEDGKELHLEILRKLAIRNARTKEIPGFLNWEFRLKSSKNRPLNLPFVKSARRHFLWALLIRPTRIFKYFGVALFLIGFYETMTITLTAAAAFSYSGEFWHNVWQALEYTFQKSPHTLVIASVCILLSTQILFFLTVLQVLQLQHDEELRHSLAIWEKISDLGQPKPLSHSERHKVGDTDENSAGKSTGNRAEVV